MSETSDPKRSEPGREGMRKRTRPSSFTGLITITAPPRSRISTSLVISRGWFDAGFAPATIARSVLSRSSSTKVEVAVPTTRVSATPDAWWQ
jgi:hypothetical protein